MYRFHPHTVVEKHFFPGNTFFLRKILENAKK